MLVGVGGGAGMCELGLDGAVLAATWRVAGIVAVCLRILPSKERILDIRPTCITARTSPASSSTGKDPAPLHHRPPILSAKVNRDHSRLTTRTLPPVVSLILEVAGLFQEMAHI